MVDQVTTALLIQIHSAGETNLMISGLSNIKSRISDSHVIDAINKVFDSSQDENVAEASLDFLQSVRTHINNENKNFSKY